MATMLGFRRSLVEAAERMVKRLRSNAWRAFGNPLEWDEVRKVFLISGALAPVILGFLFRALYMLEHPESEPYVSRVVLAQGVRVFTGFLIFSLTMVPVGLWLRRTKRSTRAYTHLANLSWWLLCAWGAYLMGLVTTPIWVVYMALSFLCLLLFDLSLVVTGSLAFLTVAGVTTIAERMGMIPYAPYLTSWPEVNGRLANEFLISGTVWPALASILAFVLFASILHRERHESEELAVASERLARANALISRYVAAQVAEKILAGDPDSIDRTERRKLTIFFSDIQGFAEIAERLDPEDLSHVLNEYLLEMTAIAEKHGGMVDKFVGDVIMVLFGAHGTTAAKDDALQAVRMAIDMQRRVDDLRKKWRDEAISEVFEARMGINTGHASVGNFGSRVRMEYTAIGRHVNLAARLQASSSPNHILISHPTWVLVHDEIPCEPRGEIQAKGVRDPVPVYQVVRTDA